jgi:hypothetical protein
MTDRGLGLAVDAAKLNVRRLMYQSLIWSGILRDNARGLRPAFDPEDVKRAADALVDGMRRNAQLDGDFLGRRMLVDEPQAIELSGAQSCHAGRKLVIWTSIGPMSGARHARSFL